MIDRIEYHVAQARERVEEGKKETTKALIYRSKARKVGFF